MRADIISLKPIYSSFLAHDQDIEKILKTLFVTSKPYSDILKRLLIINNKDCLDKDNPDYQKTIDQYSLGKMIEKGYIKFNRKIQRGTFEEIKSYITFSFSEFIPNSKNQAYLDYNFTFDVICYNDAFLLNDYKLRPLMICGYIDGILRSLTTSNINKNTNYELPIKLSGPGFCELLGCSLITLNEEFAAYTMVYHGMRLNEDIQQVGEVFNDR